MQKLKKMRPALNLDVYRRENCDLENLPNKVLKQHFREHGWRERRIFARTSSVRETLSMRWLRGRGLEIGAGGSPLPTFGETSVEYAESDSRFAYGGAGADYMMSIEQPPPEALRERFDFVVASHVLEHCDSLIRGIETMISLINERGVVYIILPDKRYLDDKDWLPDFDLEHHLTEWRDPLAFSTLHDEQFRAWLQSRPAGRSYPVFTTVSDAFVKAVRSPGVPIPQEQRFITHKHNYRFGDWVTLLPQIVSRLDERFILEDCAFATERSECHFIFMRR